MTMTKHLGKARYPAIIMLGIVFAVVYVQVHSIEQARARALMLLVAPTADELAAAMLRIGLGPAQLTAAGGSPSAVATVVDDSLVDMIANPAAIELADAAFAGPKQQCDLLKRVIQSGQATPEQITTYVAAMTQLSFAEDQRHSVLNGLLTSATASLSASQQNTLAAIRGNRNWDLPIELLTVDRTEAQWVQLREALANERISAKLGEEPDPEAQALLQQLRGNPLVATAKANLDANLAVVTTAWEQAIADTGG
ncbi:MAG: hypothetical protein IH830_03560 [Planctomycetes bacterium]|nr:hypothetical protein [Planctomycetota bacterium]